MRALRALLLGAAAGCVLAYTTAATAALALGAARAEIVVAAGPLLLLAVERTAGTTETTFGPGLAAVPVLCGIANVAAASVLARRAH